jgi:very-short-patch-repair endonuclease
MHARSPKLTHFAAQMRSSLTPSEAALWQHIRGGHLGVWFKRQVVIGRFIVDFCAPAARVVVEVDGGYHSQRRKADARRDRALARLGYHVVRLEAKLVLTQPEEAIRRICAALPP